MKKYLIVCAAFLFAACTNETTQKQDSHEGHNHATEVEAPATENTIVLDSGNKWKANVETTQGIGNMSAIVGKAIADNADPKTIHEPLQKEFENIFDKCTMEGEAHNQLHNFLIPIKGFLEKIETGDGGQETLKNFQNHLSTYGNYFE